MESPTAPRIRGRTVSATEKAQAHDVSLRRIGRLFLPHRFAIAGVTAIIVASSVVGAGLAVPAPRRHRRRAARPDLRLLVMLAAAMVVVAGVDRRARRRADLGEHEASASRSCTGCAPTSSPPAAPVRRLLHPHPHRRGAVADHQRHRRHAVGRHLDRDLDRLQPDHHRRHGGRDGRAVAGGCADLARRAAAGDLAHAAGSPGCAARSPPLQQRELADLNVTIEEGLSINGVLLSQDARHRARRWSHGSPGPRPAHRPRAALAARRPLADGVDEP